MKKDIKWGSIEIKGLEDGDLNKFPLKQVAKLGIENPMYGKKGNLNPTYGKKKNPDSVQRMRETKKGVPKTEEFKKLIGDIHRGKIVSEETRRKKSEALKGKPSPIKGRVIEKKKCPYCDMLIGGVSNLNQHIKNKHTN